MLSMHATKDREEDTLHFAEPSHISGDAYLLTDRQRDILGKQFFERKVI